MYCLLQLQLLASRRSWRHQLLCRPAAHASAIVTSPRLVAYHPSSVTSHRAIDRAPKKVVNRKQRLLLNMYYMYWVSLFVCYTTTFLNAVVTSSTALPSNCQCICQSVRRSTCKDTPVGQLLASTAVLSSPIVDESQPLPHVTVPRRSWRHIGRRSIWKGSKLYNHSQNILCKITLYNDSALIHVLFVTAATTCLNDDRYVINCFSIPLLVHRRSWRHIRQSERQSTGKDTRIGQLLASITSWRHEMLCCRIRCSTHSHFDVALYVPYTHTLHQFEPVDYKTCTTCTRF